MTDVDVISNDDDYAAMLGHQKTKKPKKKGGRWGGGKESDKVKGGGASTNGIKHEAGRVNRSRQRKSEYHLFPRCPLPGVSRADSA